MGNCASTGKHRFSASPDDIAVEMSSTQAAKEPPLCMIHGLMGCTMRKTGALAFIPVRAALGLPTPSLALPMGSGGSVRAMTTASPQRTSTAASAIPRWQPLSPARLVMT